MHARAPTEAVAACGGDAASNASLPPSDLSRDGPYGCVVVHSTLRAPRPDRGPARPTRLALTVSAPTVAPAEPPLPGPPYPVVLMMNGFQARASQYAPIARRLATWGFLVMQYTCPALTIIHDDIELGFAGHVLDWLAQANETETNVALHGRADLSRLCVAGHSRGAKLAALHFATSQRGGASEGEGLPARYRVWAAFLMDPVDNTDLTPESDCYPSACKALAASGAPVAIAGAGVIGSTNPEGSNWKQFWAAAAPGSWLGVLPRADHIKWLNGPWGECWFLDKIFGGGTAPRRVVTDATAATMIAWFTQQLAAASTTKATPTDPLGPAATAASCAVEAAAASPMAAPRPQEVRVAAAAVYGTVAEPAPGAPDAFSSVDSMKRGGALPPALSPWLSNLVETGDLVFSAKGGAATSHPL